MNLYNLLLFEVSPLVIFHVAFGGESFRAKPTHKRFFLCVDTQMDYQIRALGKGLITSFKIASVWLSAIMQMLMCLQSTFP